MLARRRDASVPPPLWNVRNVLPATIIDDLDHAAVRRELKSGHIGTGARRLEVKDDLHAYGANHIERRAATLHQTAKPRALPNDRFCEHPVSYTHLRAHETPEHLVCRLLLEKK